MLNNKDRENIEQAAQTAASLMNALRALQGADNPLLAEIAYGLLENAAALKSKLDRLLIITAEGGQK